MEEPQTRPDTGVPDYPPGYYEDEIELIDLFKVIWKWKVLILAGTLICAVGAAVISWNMTDIYRVQMAITPGIARLDDDGRKIYMDAGKDIQTSVEMGTFNARILQKLDVPDGQERPESLKFKVASPKGLNALEISCETAYPAVRVQALGHLGNLLQEKYLDLVGHHQKVFEMAQKKRANEAAYLDNRIADKKAEGVTKKEQINNLKERYAHVQEEVGRLSKNTEMLIAERNGFLPSKESEKNVLSALLYSNTIQQNISYLNTLRNTADQIKGDIVGLELDIEKLQTALKDLDSRKRYILEEINDLELRKNSVQNIEILQPPTSSQDPIKPKKALNIMLAAVAGLFAMVFSAFFLEYIQKHKGELGS
jgi:LPS O-antigen subunit length determinant protein (WzzB/FepE family)